MTHRRDDAEGCDGVGQPRPPREEAQIWLQTPVASLDSNIIRHAYGPLCNNPQGMNFGAIMTAVGKLFAQAAGLAEEHQEGAAQATHALEDEGWQRPQSLATRLERYGEVQLVAKNVRLVKDAIEDLAIGAAQGYVASEGVKRTIACAPEVLKAAACAIGDNAALFKIHYQPILPVSELEARTALADVLQGAMPSALEALQASVKGRGRED